MNKLLIYFSNYYANQLIQLKKNIYREFRSIIISPYEIQMFQHLNLTN